MPLILDIFNNRAFSAIELTESINLVPNQYGRLQEMGLFSNRSSRTRSVALQINNGQLSINLLPSRPYGGTPTYGLPYGRQLKSFGIPHFPHNDFVLAADVQDMVGRNLGNFGLLEVMDLVNEKLEIMTQKHFITWEFMRWGALQGLIFDADGVLLLDIYAEFGLTRKSIDFTLDTAGTLEPRITELKRWMESNLYGSPMNGIHVFCSPGFMDDLLASADLKEIRTQFRGDMRLGVDYHNSVTVNGVTFEEHDGMANDVNGGVHKFVPDDQAIAVPLGTVDVFRQWWAPADFIESVNSPGLQTLYAKQKRMDFDRGIEIHTQSNPLPLVQRPQLVVTLLA
jgi:Phage major capsid protein E